MRLNDKSAEIYATKRHSLEQFLLKNLNICSWHPRLNNCILLSSRYINVFCFEKMYSRSRIYFTENDRGITTNTITSSNNYDGRWNKILLSSCRRVCSTYLLTHLRHLRLYLLIGLLHTFCLSSHYLPIFVFTIC